MSEYLLPKKFGIRDFNEAYYIPTADVPHKKQWHVRETLAKLLSTHYPQNEVNLRFLHDDGFYGPNKYPDTVLFANDWVLPYATAWLFTAMGVGHGVLRVEVPEIEKPLIAALVEIPVRVTEAESPLSSMFSLALISGLEDLK